MPQPTNSNQRISILLLGLASGLYPILFYYSRNYSLINTWKHLGFFLLLFLIFPLVTFLIAKRLLRRRSGKVVKQVFVFLNTVFFLNFMGLCIYAKPIWWWVLVALFTAFLLAKFWWVHLKKVMVFQFLLAGIGVFFLVPVLLAQLNYSETWKEQPDAIVEVQFKQKPNVYVIQPDGYVSFSEISRGHYGFANTEFRSLLEKQQFTVYPNTRSNYSTTLTSNSAIFTMKHHYYNNGFNFSEMMNARALILGDNPVLQIFQKNHYKTHFFSEYGYLQSNHPKVAYDVTNFHNDEIPFLSTGFELKKEILPSLKVAMAKDTLSPKFFFIELFEPGHISAFKKQSAGAENEKRWWKIKMDSANVKLTNILTHIEQHDPNSLVVLLSDHGGYVGLEYMQQLRTKTQNRDAIYAGFSSLIAIKWPKITSLSQEMTLKTGVNVFRNLFAYLADEKKYLNHLQEEASFHIIDAGAPKGVYKYIDSRGEIVFERIK